jgi:hypothetical protein
MTPGSTVLVERDPTGDHEDRPLKLTIVPPKKPLKKPEPEREKIGVGAKRGGEGAGDPPPEGLAPGGDGQPEAEEPPAPDGDAS